MKKNLTKSLILFLTVISCFALTACAGSASTEYDVVKRTKAENFALLNQTAKTGQIVMIGDSIVELYPASELFVNFPSKESPLIVYNRGISGDTSDRMLERLEKNALNIAPRVLSILVGTNDFNRLTKEETLQNIESAVSAAFESGVERVVVQSLYPVSAAETRDNRVISEYNEAYRDLCARTGAVYVDVHAALKDENGEFKEDLTYDGLHPNAKGYVAITEILKPYFEI